jgi:hypothetical protein
MIHVNCVLGCKVHGLFKRFLHNGELNHDRGLITKSVAAAIAEILCALYSRGRRIAIQLLSQD